MVLIADMVLAMVLIEDSLLTVLICAPVMCWRSKCYYCYLRRCQDGTPPVVSSNTVLLAAECGPAITTIMTLIK